MSGKSCHIILLSGGAGKRLWPLSSPTRPKQLLKLLRNEEGKAESMLQRVFRQIGQADMDGDITVVAGKEQAPAIRAQLGDRVELVAEPERRDTFPAIALAGVYLAREKGADPEEIVLVLPADSYVEEDYFHTLHRMKRAVEAGAADLVLMGIRPTCPSAQYGYIIPDDEAGTVDGFPVWPVSRFREKPREEEAAALLEQGALWNGGVFAFRLGYLLELVRGYLPTDCYSYVYDHYDRLNRTSFDYEVAERASSVAAVGYDGPWKDLGTWNSLSQVMDGKAVGRVRIGRSTEHAAVINELDIPILVLGAKNLIVAACEDGILIADRESSANIKPYVEELTGVEDIP